MAKPKSQNRRQSGKKVPQDRPVRGKIGKPQRSKKHKKIKSVDFNAGWASIAVGNFGRHIKNLPPPSVIQEVPKTATRLKRAMCNLDPDRKRKRKKKKGSTEMRGPREKDGNFVSKEFKFVQRRGETDKAFDNRMEAATQREILKAQLEEKYDVDIVEPREGGVIVKKHRSERQKEKDKERKAKKKAKKRRKESEDELEVRKDEVKFGEVVMEPPSHLKRKNVEVSAGAGKRDLLLKELFHAGGQAGPSSVPTKQSGSVAREVGQTVKRKLLSPAAKFRMDQARDSAIQRYRQLKKNAGKSVSGV